MISDAYSFLIKHNYSFYDFNDTNKNKNFYHQQADGKSELDEHK